MRLFHREVSREAVVDGNALYHTCPLHARDTHVFLGSEFRRVDSCCGELQMMQQSVECRRESEALYANAFRFATLDRAPYICYILSIASQNITGRRPISLQICVISSETDMSAAASASISCISSDVNFPDATFAIL